MVKASKRQELPTPRERSGEEEALSAELVGQGPAGELQRALLDRLNGADAGPAGAGNLHDLPPDRSLADSVDTVISAASRLAGPVLLVLAVAALVVLII